MLAGEDHGFAFGGAHGEGFLAQDVFTGLGSANSPLAVEMIGQSDIDYLHAGIIQEGLVVVVNMFDGEL